MTTDTVEEHDTDVRTLFVVLLIAGGVLLLRSRVGPTFESGMPRAWMTVFISISVQAVPFLVLGVTLSAFIAAFVSPAALARALPKNPTASVVVAGGAGMALPGCECGAVPVAGRLIGGRAPAAAALTFLLAAPAINPIVLASTATAFPGQPELVAARFLASLATAVIMGLVWLRIGDGHGDAFQAYVRPVMFVPLAISTAIIGGPALWSSFGFDEVDDIDDVEGGEDIDEEVFSHDDHGHEHSGIPRIGWWLVVPIACIAIVPLRPLGASSVRESRANEATIRSIEDRTPAVVGADGEMTLLDFVSRVVNEPDTPVPGTVELTGFVSSTDDDGFVLARFVMSCCAADAQPMLVTVRWAGDAPAVDSWVTVEGTHVPPPPDTPPERRIEAENVIVQAESVTEVDEPADPYESY